MTVPMALSRACAPLLAAWLADGRFPAVMGAVATLSTPAVLPIRLPDLAWPGDRRV